MTIFTRSTNTLSPDLFLVELNNVARTEPSDSAVDGRLPWRISGESSLTALLMRFLRGE